MSFDLQSGDEVQVDVDVTMVSGVIQGTYTGRGIQGPSTGYGAHPIDAGKPRLGPNRCRSDITPIARIHRLLHRMVTISGRSGSCLVAKSGTVGASPARYDRNSTCQSRRRCRLVAFSTFAAASRSRHPCHEDHLRSRDPCRGAGDPRRRVLEAHDHARRQHHCRGGDGRRDLSSSIALRSRATPLGRRVRSQELCRNSRFGSRRAECGKGVITYPSRG